MSAPKRRMPPADTQPPKAPKLGPLSPGALSFIVPDVDLTAEDLDYVPDQDTDTEANDESDEEEVEEVDSEYESELDGTETDVDEDAFSVYSDDDE